MHMTVPELEKAVKELNHSSGVLRRNISVMTLRLNKYSPIVNIMIKLNLIKEWVEPAR
jgi:hypothetical protein